MSFSRFYSPTTDFERYIEEPLSGLWHGRHALAPYEETRTSRTMQARMDLYENTDKNLMVATFELPGLSKDKVQIDVQNGNLSISGECGMSSEQQEHGFAVKERRYGKFVRTVKLPEGTQAKDVKASMENGVLTVTYPKTSPGQGSQRITID